MGNLFPLVDVSCSRARDPEHVSVDFRGLPFFFHSNLLGALSRRKQLESGYRLPALGHGRSAPVPLQKSRSE